VWPSSYSIRREFQRLDSKPKKEALPEIVLRRPTKSIAKFRARAARLLVGLGLLLSPLAIARAEKPDDQRVSDLIGAIDGEAIAVTGPMSVETVNGQIRTQLRSGADVRVKSGTARIDLVEGGQIVICGPAHLSVLKSGGSLTVALDTGTIHAYIEHEPALTIYTAQIKAQPVPIGDAPQDTSIGLDAAGAMCIRASRGAVRLEHQLTGQSMVIPQTGDVQLTNGQLDSLRRNAGHCACELQLEKLAAHSSVEVSRVATTEEIRRDRDLRDSKPNLPASREEKPAPPAVREEPIYQVIVPPLVYNAKAAVQPDIDSKMIVLIRRVRVRPTLIFQGRVEGEIVATAAAPPPSPAAPATPQPAAKKAAPPVNDSFVDRVRHFVRRLWSSNS
jgi:hypothetical protein